MRFESLLIFRCCLSDAAYRPKTIVEIRREDPNEEYENFIERVKKHTTPEYRKYLQVSCFTPEAIMNYIMPVNQYCDSGVWEEE